jgi:hypothetical protein
VIATCRTCQAEFHIEPKIGRRPVYCSQNCRRRGLPELPTSAVCLTCGETFRPGRPGGVEQLYCSRLCNPRYGWACTVCGELKNAGNRRPAEKAAEYVCQPCRRARAEERIPKRVAVPGTVRPLDIRSGILLSGPSLLQEFAAWQWSDGSTHVECPWCAGLVNMEPGDRRRMCNQCLILITVEESSDVAS